MKKPVRIQVSDAAKIAKFGVDLDGLRKEHRALLRAYSVSLTRQGTRIEKLETRASGFSGDIGTLEEQFPELEEGLKRAEFRITALEGQIGLLAGTIKDLIHYNSMLRRALEEAFSLSYNQFLQLSPGPISVVPAEHEQQPSRIHRPGTKAPPKPHFVRIGDKVPEPIRKHPPRRMSRLQKGKGRK